MIHMLETNNLQMIKNIIYVLYDLYNSKLNIQFARISRESLLKLYITSVKCNPSDLLSYYKKTIINKYADNGKEVQNDK